MAKQKRGYIKYIKIILLIYPLIIFIILDASTVCAEHVVLSWDAPTINADGTFVTDLDGYNIYYGTSSGNYSQSIDVGNVTTYTVPNLSEGYTYYFAVTAYDTYGNESGYSNEVSKSISSANQQCALTVYKSATNTGTGTIASSPSGIYCGSDCTEAYNAGTIVSLTATPDASSNFGEWSSIGCSGTGQCIITMNSDINVTALFTLKTFTITATAGTWGSISPSVTISVNYGGSETFTIRSNKGYEIADVRVDGASVGVISSYTFRNVTNNHTIETIFTEKMVTKRGITKKGGKRRNSSPKASLDF